MEMWPLQSLFQDVGFDAPKDLDTSIGSETRQDTLAKYGVPWDLKIRGIGTATYVSLPERDIMEIDEDGE